MEDRVETPWGVTYCPECDLWTAEIKDGLPPVTDLFPEAEGDPYFDGLLYTAVCACGYSIVQPVWLESSCKGTTAKGQRCMAGTGGADTCRHHS